MATDLSRGRPGVILVAHGSARSAASADPVLALVWALRRRGFPEVQPAFWKEEPFLHQALQTTRSATVLVLPVFLAEGYFSRTVVPRELGLAYGWNRVGGRSVRLLPPLGTAAALADLVMERARAATPPDVPPEDALLLVLGHGTPRDPGSAAAVQQVCARLRARGGFGRVAPAFIEQEPRWEDAIAEASERLVLLVPFLVAAGWHGGTTVPRDLDRQSAGPRGSRRVIYTEPVGTHPGLARVVESVLLDGSAGDPDVGPEERAPLDRLEAPLHERLAERGRLVLLQALVRTTPDGYELRHAADADTPAERLTVIPDREALERWGRRTAEGRHRPLRTAGDLAPGWRLPTRSVGGVVDALVALYGPALVHWHLGEEGALPPTDFARVAGRQSGLYARLTQVDGAAVEAGVRACCEGRPCLRARTWGPSPGPRLGDDPAVEHLRVPCPEPCPILLTTVLEMTGGADPESD